jgi:hypothetical protein
MAHKVMIEVHGNKKRRETTWLPLTRGARHDKPRQGQDTRLCRDATNKAIKAVRGVIKSRDKLKYRSTDAGADAKQHVLTNN